MRKITENKRGWIKILEAFLAILFIIGILTILSFNNNKSVENKFFFRIQEKQMEILHLIQVNDSLRVSALGILPGFPIKSNEIGFPPNLNNTLMSNTPEKLECILNLCSVEDACELNDLPEKKEVSVESIIVSSTHSIYNPRKLVMFCWKK